MAPPPDATIGGMAYLLVRIMLVRLTDMTLPHSSWLTSVTRPGPLMPTLLWRTWRAPYLSRAACTMARHCSSWVTSATKTLAWPPSSWIASRVLAARSSTLSTRSTFAPSRAKRMLTALPLPMTSPRAPAPVTMATLFCSLGLSVVHFVSLEDRNGLYSTLSSCPVHDVIAVKGGRVTAFGAR